MLTENFTYTFSCDWCSNLTAKTDSKLLPEGWYSIIIHSCNDISRVEHFCPSCAERLHTVRKKFQKRNVDNPSAL
jgi:hypothetical protein